MRAAGLSSISRRLRDRRMGILINDDIPLVVQLSQKRRVGLFLPALYRIVVDIVCDTVVGCAASNYIACTHSTKHRHEIYTRVFFWSVCYGYITSFTGPDYRVASSCFTCALRPLTRVRPTHDLVCSRNYRTSQV
jgi:hypothetical protein